MIQVTRGSLAEQEVDGILRPMRSDAAPVSAAGRDLIQLAGEILEEKLAQLGTVPIGGAVMTPSGALKADFVIHVVVASPEEPETSQSVQRALRNGLRRATDWEMASLALPPMGMGVGTMEADGPAQVMLELLFNHLDEGNKPLDLRIVVSSEYEEGVFSRLVTQMARARELGN